MHEDLHYTSEYFKELHNNQDDDNPQNTVCGLQ